MDDWQLRPSTRQRWVRKIMAVLKKHHPASDEDSLLELRKIAQRLEEKAYSTATSRSGYPRIINSKLKSMEALDWQEEVYQKIKTMKEIYLPELNEIYQKIVAKLQQHNSLPQQPVPDQVEKVRVFKAMLECIMAFLQVSKSQIAPNFKEKLGPYEKQIINFINTATRRKAVSPHQGPLPPSHMHSTQQPQSQISQVPSQKNVPIFISIPSNSAGNSSKPPIPVDLNSIYTPNWRPNQVAEPTIHASGWRAELQPESRERIVRKILDALIKHLPVSGEAGLRELQKIAQRFEEKIYTAATSQSDYLRKISLKMLTMDSKSANPTPSNPAGKSSKPPVLVNLNLMPANNWESNQGAEPTIHASDWRAQLRPESRRRLVTKIMDTLSRHLPVSGSEGLHEIENIAQGFEEKIYSAATSQSDYLRKISLKLLTFENKSQNSIANSMPSNSASNSSKTPISGLGMQSQNDGDLTNGRRTTSASKRKR